MSFGAMEIRQATERDIERILAIERASSTAPHWTREAYVRMLTPDPHAPRSRCLLTAIGEVAGRSREVVGFAVAAVFVRACAGPRLPAELESVAVLDIARRHGVGLALCRAALDWAAENGASGMELEVRAGNAPAIWLYRRLGFYESGCRRGYYQDPEDDALLMCAKLGSGDQHLRRGRR